MNESNRSGNFEMRGTPDERFRVFIPRGLPVSPPIEWSDQLLDLAEKANRSIGRLDGLSGILPDTSLFLYGYIRKEAVLSSQIEGTQSSFSDLLLFEHEELPDVPIDDLKEVSNYVSAMNHGLARLREGFPLSLRLIREIHGILLQSGRGSEKTPGEFRTTQNWVGGSRPGNALYIPPPPDQVTEHMGALEKFLHDDPVRTPTLMKAGLAHAQFESIHPFLDGNGRVGRLMITFLLCAEGALKEPLLYLSHYLKKNRDTYYELLQAIRTQGAWEPWLEFFFRGVMETADQANATARTLIDLFRADEARIQSAKRSGSAVQVHRALQKIVIGTITELSRLTGLTQPTVTTALERLAQLGIAEELSGRRRGRLFRYSEYLRILIDGTEPAEV